MESGFRLFGRDHLATLAALFACGPLIVLAARRGSGSSRRRFRWLLAFMLAACHLVENGVALFQGWYQIRMLPLEMCDLAAIFGIYGLLTEDVRAVGPAYFFALSGTLPALVTPELDVTFPHVRFVVYFIEHGLTVITPLTLVLGLGIVPGAMAWFRAFLIINAFAALNAGINFALGTNFMYLSRKPNGPTPFDWFGPWPGYLAVLEVVVLVVFRLLAIPLSVLRASGASDPGLTGKVRAESEPTSRPVPLRMA
jgi:hypothetical integral membrane protein (TIGR02206 family)